MDSSLHSVSLSVPELRARVFERSVRPHSARNARMQWSDRTSLILALTDRDGRTGLGEAAPLPGFSCESLAEARDELEVLLQAPHGEPNLRCASVRFAWDCARLDLLGQQSAQPAWARLSPSVPERLECNALLTCRPSEWRDAIESLIARGVRTVKLKIGFADVDLDAHVDALRALDAALPAEVRLRLDANGAFAADDAARLREALPGVRFEFIEDPVQASALHTLSANGMRWAADQLARDEPAVVARCSARDGLAALILKPTLLGSIPELLLATREAHARGVDVVLTHAFEGPIAHAALVHLAFVVSELGTPRAMGLATHDVLRQWPFAAPAHEWELERPRAPGLGLATARLLHWLESP